MSFCCAFLGLVSRGGSSSPCKKSSVLFSFICCTTSYLGTWIDWVEFNKGVWSFLVRLYKCNILYYLPTVS